MGSKKTQIRTCNNCSELLSLTLVKETMQLLSGKWKMQIVTFLLKNGITHFMDLQRGVEGISATMLSKELQELQQREIVARRMLNTKLISVEYELTKHGKTLESLILSITSWGAAHRKHLCNQHDNP